MTFTVKKIIFYLVIPLVVVGLLIGLIVYNVRTGTGSIKNPTVKTLLGTIEGLIAEDGNYSMFLGIPYARVDTNNPFGPSIPEIIYEGVIEAHNDNAICPQYSSCNKTIIGTLDCLHLNIYVPNDVTEKNPVPVLVYIHGGEYISGSASKDTYGPKFLVSHDIVVVTFNYRLGIYGFSCIDTPDIAGNQGLKDQVKALRWIKDNINAFGGDPDKITIAGIGTGGEHVKQHLLYNKESLFHNAIIESGITIDTNVNEFDILVPLNLSLHLGMETKDLQTALSYIASKDPVDVITAALELNLKYGMCIEKPYQNVDNFVTYDSLKSNVNNMRRVPILIGHSNNERSYIYANRHLNSDNITIFRDELNKVFHFNNTNQMRKSETNMRHFYIGDDDINDDVKQRIIDFTSDLYNYFPVKRTIDRFVDNGAKKIYYSVFSYCGGRNLAKIVHNVTMPGATREDQLAYLFDISALKDPIDPADQVMINVMTTLWANFVKYSDPTHNSFELLPVQWMPVIKGYLNFLNINTLLETGVTPFHNRTAFWELFYKLNGNVEKTKLEF